MKNYYVTIDVKKIYGLSIEAKSKMEAIDKAEAMQTEELYGVASLKDVETNVVSVEEDGQL